MYTKKIMRRCTVLLSYITLTAHGANLIESVVVAKNVVRVIANKEFTATYLKQDFFAQYNQEINLEPLDYTIVTLPFIMNVAPIVWISNKTYYVDAMDQDVYNALCTLQKIFQAFYPKTSWSGHLIPKKLVKNTVTQPSGKTAVLFSHGLDAVYTSLRHKDTKQLLITVCGGDIGIHQQEMWEGVRSRCRTFAHQHGHTNAFVRSNFNIFRDFKYLVTRTAGQIKNWFGQTSQSLSYIGLAAPIAYAQGCTKVLLASTRTSDNPFPYGTHPVIDNTLAFASITVDHDAPQVNRVEKIRQIAALCTTHALPKPMLRVCWGKDPHGGNCTSCEKCFRTIVELLVEGQLPSDYGFNITLEQALTAARASAPGTTTLDNGLMWHWRCIQEAAQKAVHTPVSTLDNPAYKPFLIWLATLNLDQFKNPNSCERSPQEKQAFAMIWKKAADHTFTLGDLELLPRNTHL